jgi:hypothetical protein
MVYLLVNDCNKFKAYYSLSRLCKENGFRKIQKEELPLQMGNFKITTLEIDTRI